MIAPLAMGVADVSVASFLSEEQKTNLYLAKSNKDALKMQSTITLRNGDAASTLKSATTNSNPEYLVTASLLNVREMIQKNIPQGDWWKHTTTSMKYYGTTSGEMKTPRGTSVLQYMKVLTQMVEKEISESHSQSSAESI